MSFFPRDLAAPAEPAAPVIDWEEPNCLLCGSRNWSPLVEAADQQGGADGFWFVVVQCQACGLCFTNPRPTPETIGQFYGVGRDETRRQGDRGKRRLAKGLGVRRLRLRSPCPPVSLSPCLFGPRRGRGRLLDLGCGGGSLLTRMHGEQWQVTALDVSTTAVQHLRTELGLRAFVGSLPHPEFRAASFDVITMWHSLEHVHAPQEVLREAHRLLAPGGRLLVAVPNIDSLPFRWFGSAWCGLDLPRHLTHFAPWTLHLMLERVGFDVGPIRMVRHSNWLRQSARLALQTKMAPLWHRWLAAKPASHLAGWYCYLTRQSDCIVVTAER